MISGEVRLLTREKLLLQILDLKRVSRGIVSLDKKHKDKEADFVSAESAKRDQTERDGITDRHQKKQSKSPPTIDVNFVGTRIEQIWEFAEADSILELIWCKGKVVGVKNNKK